MEDITDEQYEMLLIKQDLRKKKLEELDKKEGLKDE